MGRKNNMPWFTLILCLTIFLSFAKAQTNTTTTLTLHRRSPPATCRPRPQKEYVTFVLMDFTGFPIKVTDTVLDRLSVSFRRVYNRLSVHQCDALYRYVRSVSARVIDEGIGVAATFANPAIITVAFRVEYLCFGCECPERGFLLAPDDIVTPLANSTYNNYFFTSRTTRALHELHQQLQEDDEMPFDEEEEEETMLFDEQDVMEFDDKEDDHDYSWLNDPFLVESSERHRRELQILDLSHFPPLPTVDPLLEDGRPPPCGCTNPRADYNAPTSRELVFGYRRAVLEGQSLAAASVLSLLTALEVSPVDCTGLDGAPGGPIEEFNQTLTYTIAADPFNVTAIERGLLGNILTSTFNYYSRINCDGRFLELDETVVLDDITIPPSRLLRRRLELVTNIGGFTGGRCRGCRCELLLVSCRVLWCI